MKGHIKERSPGKWAIVLDVADPETGKRRRKWHAFHGSKRQAENECARLIAELDGGSYIEPAKTTVREFLVRWLCHEKANVAPKTHERYEELLLKNIAPVIGNVIMNKLTASRIDGCWTHLLESGRRNGNGGLSPRTVHHCRRVLLTAFDQAVRWDLLKKNPVALTRPPKVEKKMMEAFNASQTAVMLDDLRKSRVFIAALLAALCGLRRGEIIALRWRDVDLATATIAVRQSAEQVGTEVRYKETKSGKSRSVALSSTVLEELKRHRLAQAEEQLKLGTRPGTDSFVIAQIDGSPLKPVSLTHEWTRLLAKTSLPRIRFHDLRHSHATQLLAAGVHPKIASERLGHSTIGITLDLYSHVMPGMQANAAEQVDAAIKAAKNQTIE
ncbi:tyrosine-type recombinase/integrase [Agrobacterium vitis]|uniref:tyrosine-type recombinase/integrase n=1 Tax=Agrobacterium vitis TaxID=373 RepID=UPI001571C0A0|nr:tyrosine-type recombinase/integrase [Agrobacterium vitis]NSZ19334.1 site-specific integrase [Agrobacterium vitis]QZO06202.1 site-specific integrase [Agrobacterium vitis]UJL90525.1 site-specific integrase [Agrobacterium vitis]